MPLIEESGATPLRSGFALRTGRAQNGAMADPAAFAERVHLLWIGVGTDEPERMKTGLENLHAALDQGNIKHVFYESPGTNHEWQTWRRDLKDLRRDCSSQPFNSPSQPMKGRLFNAVRSGDPTR